jgi:hypothetical protein
MVVAIRTALWSELEGVVDLLGREEFLLIVLLVWLAVAGAASLDAILARFLRAGGEPGRVGPLASPRREAARP